MFFEYQFRDIARQYLSKRGLPFFENYHLIRISDLEVLSAWNARAPMQLVLSERSQQLASEKGTKDFSIFRWEYSKAHGFGTAHPLLEQVQDEFFSKHFSIGEVSSQSSLDQDLTEAT